MKNKEKLEVKSKEEKLIKRRERELKKLTLLEYEVVKKLKDTNKEHLKVLEDIEKSKE